mmetsp:Transcript_17635/g.42767  ORF Transcript_17635/g.42767 Transcript_17635/m.42767 type:complete len:291 (-) Transcript_17635:7447-8319(-)|eukprot:1670843-Rhodomonas_salina.3
MKGRAPLGGGRARNGKDGAHCFLLILEVGHFELQRSQTGLPGAACPFQMRRLHLLQNDVPGRLEDEALEAIGKLLVQESVLAVRGLRQEKTLRQEFRGEHRVPQPLRQHQERQRLDRIWQRLPGRGQAPFQLGADARGEEALAFSQRVGHSGGASEALRHLGHDVQVVGEQLVDERLADLVQIQQPEEEGHPQQLQQLAGWRRIGTHAPAEGVRRVEVGDQRTHGARHHYGAVELQLQACTLVILRACDVIIPRTAVLWCGPGRLARVLLRAASNFHQGGVVEAAVHSLF